MNNKRGGVGAKILIVLILMIASAVGGAYAYRVLDGKMAVREAMKAVEAVDVSDYDTAEQQTIQGYIDNATKDLNTAKTRKEVYEVIGTFINEVDKVQTKSEKELEAALKEAEEAKKQLSERQQPSYDNESTNTGTDTDADTNVDTSTETDDSSYKSNDLNTGTEDEKEDSGLLGSLLGGLSSGADGD